VAQGRKLPQQKVAGLQVEFGLVWRRGDRQLMKLAVLLLPVCYSGEAGFPLGIAGVS